MLGHSKSRSLRSGDVKSQKSRGIVVEDVAPLLFAMNESPYDVAGSHAGHSGRRAWRSSRMLPLVVAGVTIGEEATDEQT